MDHCVYCKREMKSTLPVGPTQKTNDHLVPRCAGGELVVEACHECNNTKGHMSANVFLDLMSYATQNGWLDRGKLKHLCRRWHAAHQLMGTSTPQDPLQAIQLGDSFYATREASRRKRKVRKSKQYQDDRPEYERAIDGSDPYDTVLGKPQMNTLAWAIRTRRLRR